MTRTLPGARPMSYRRSKTGPDDLVRPEPAPGLIRGPASGLRATDLLWGGPRVLLVAFPLLHITHSLAVRRRIALRRRAAVSAVEVELAVQAIGTGLTEQTIRSFSPGL